MPNSAPILKDDPTPEDVRRAHENWLRDPWVLAGDDARARLRTLLEPHVDKHGAVSFEFYQEPEWSTFALLDEVAVPVLIVVGEADIADVHAHSGAIEAALRDVRRIVVPDAGHLVYFEQPAAFNRLVVDFLAR
ncbi:MAG TPA: alpha/beta fold hydrolase [Longimicrobiales bacterium]|nr:alpha/beta fold hydrolase [Longimicrobiales bacterium]